MKIIDLLDALKTQEKISSNYAIAQSIKDIIEHCRSNFYCVRFDGDSAFNRKMLLDPYIADKLSADVIKFLFTVDNDSAHVPGSRQISQMSSIRDAIYYGFKDGLCVINYMPNNDMTFSYDKYKDHIESYTNNTRRIINAIIKASGAEAAADFVETSSATMEQLYKFDLLNEFDKIVLVINDINTKELSRDLCSVPGYDLEDMHSQVVRGFNLLLGSIGLDQQSSLHDICHKFLSTPDALLHGWVSHLFYDRAHIEAALDQKTQVELAGIQYTYTDIFRQIITTYCKNPGHYPDVAKEQLYIRLLLVEQDLQNRFETSFKQVFDANNLANPDVTPDAIEVSNPDTSDVATPDASSVVTPDTSDVVTPDTSDVATPDVSSVDIPDTSDDGIHKHLFDLLDKFIGKIKSNQAKVIHNSNYSGFDTDTVCSVVSSLETAKTKFEKSNALQQFCKDISEAINNPDVIALCKAHRGFKKIFKDILFMITGILTFGFGFGTLYNNFSGMGFFNPKTNSQEIYDELNNGLEIPDKKR